MAARWPVFLVLALVLAILATGLYFQWRYPRRIVAHGEVRVTARDGNRGALVARTRTSVAGFARFEEVALPNGTWIDCGGDCAQAYLDQTSEFWRKRQEQGR